MVFILAVTDVFRTVPINFTFADAPNIELSVIVTVVLPVPDIVSVISMFGFLNRWNDTLGTKLEDVPKSFVDEKLKPLGWS